MPKDEIVCKCGARAFIADQVIEGELHKDPRKDHVVAIYECSQGCGYVMSGGGPFERKLWEREFTVSEGFGALREGFLMQRQDYGFLPWERY